MSEDPDEPWGSEPPEYQVYRSGGASRPRKQRPPARASSERQAQGSDREAQGYDRQGRPTAGPPGRGSSQRSSRPPSSRSPQDSQDSPYGVYRSAPRGLRGRLRAESDPELELERASSRRSRAPARKGSWWRTWSVRRAIKYLVLAVVGWVVLSFALFMISAGQSPAVRPPRSAS